MKVRSLEKMPKRVVMADEVLGVDDLVDLLQDVCEKRSEVKEFVLIYTDKEGMGHHYWDGTNEGVLWALESAKKR